MATSIIDVTFARGAQAWTPQKTFNAQSIVPNFVDQGALRNYAWTGPLPDITLAPQSLVRLIVIRGGSANNAVTLKNVVTVLTREEAASSIGTLPAGPFMLVPGPQA